MDTNTTVLIVVAILAIVAVVGFIRFGQRGKTSLKGPFNTGVDFEGSNEPTPGAQIVDSKTKEGGALAEDTTGRGAKIQGVEAKDDLIASSSPPPENDAPKA